MFETDAALERNRLSTSQEEKVEEEASFNTPDDFASWPSTNERWPSNTNRETARVVTPSSPGAFDISNSRLQNAPSSPVALQSRISQSSASAFHDSGVVYASQYMPRDPNTVPTVPVEGVYNEEASDNGVDMEAPADRSPPMDRNRNASKRDFSWRKPVSGLGLLVLVSVILVIPAIFVLAIVLPIALAPEPS